MRKRYGLISRALITGILVAGVLVVGLLELGTVQAASMSRSVTLSFGGDINLAQGTYQANPRPFDPIAPALRADVVAANLESPLTNQPKIPSRSGSGIDLRVSPAAVSALSVFTHLGSENNHIRDGGEAGRWQSLRVLRAAGLVPLTRQVTWLTVRGMRVALIAYLDDGQSPLPLTEVGQAARQADLVVVLPHWGAEYGGVIARQRLQARQLVAAGANLIVGSGPHILQTSERIDSALVLYSLGNLLFDQPYPATWPGAVVRVSVPADSKSSTGPRRPTDPQIQNMRVCAVATFSRAGRVRLATGPERRLVGSRLGLKLCADGGGRK